MRLTFFEEWADIEQMGIPTLDDYTRAFAELDRLQGAAQKQAGVIPDTTYVGMANVYSPDCSSQYNQGLSLSNSMLGQQSTNYSSAILRVPWVYRLTISNDYRGQMAHIDHGAYATPEERTSLLASGWYPTPDEARKAILGS